MNTDYKDGVICTGQSNMTLLLQSLISMGVYSDVWVTGQGEGGQQLANNTWLSLATPWTRSVYYNQLIQKQGSKKYKRLVSVFWQGESDADTTPLSLSHAAKVEQYHRFLAQDLLEEGGQLFEIIVLPWSTLYGSSTEYTNVRNGLTNYVNKSPNTRFLIDSQSWARYDHVHVTPAVQKANAYIFVDKINEYLARTYQTDGGEHATKQYVTELLKDVGTGTGDVTGPAGSVSVNALAVFATSNGKSIKQLANGTNGQVLSISGGIPAWVTLSAGSGDVLGVAGSAVTNQIAIYDSNNPKRITTLNNDTSVKWVKVGTTGAVILENAGTTRTSLGFTTIGTNLITLANPAGDRWMKISSTGIVTLTDASTIRSDIGANNASNLSAGTIPADRLPLPTTTVRGAVIANAGSTDQFVTGISTSTGQLTYGTAVSNQATTPPVGSLVVYNNTSGNKITGLTNDTSNKWIRLNTSGVAEKDTAAETIRNLTNVGASSNTSITLQDSDNGKIIRTSSTSSAVTITVPAGLSANFSCMIVQGTTQVVTLQGASGVTLRSFSNYLKLAGQYATATIVASDISGEYIVAGNLIA